MKFHSLLPLFCNIPLLIINHRSIFDFFQVITYKFLFSQRRLFQKMRYHILCQSFVSCIIRFVPDSERPHFFRNFNFLFIFRVLLHHLKKWNNWSADNVFTSLPTLYCRFWTIQLYSVKKDFVSPVRYEVFLCVIQLCNQIFLLTWATGTLKKPLVPSPWLIVLPASASSPVEVLLSGASLHRDWPPAA